MSVHSGNMQSSMDRRQLLRGLGASGAVLAAGGLTAGSAAQAAPGDQEFTPFDLHFGLRDRIRPFDLVSPNFVQHRATPGPVTELTRTDTGPVAPYAAVVLDVAVVSDVLRAGLVTADGDSVLAVQDPNTSKVSVEVTRSGRTSVVGEVRAELTHAFRFAFVLNENHVTVLADTRSGWEPLLRERVVDLVDLREPATLRTHHYGYGSADAVINRAEAGYYGQVGVRDPHLVTHADGTPYVRDGRFFLTHTSAGLGFFETAHWGVWSMDPADPAGIEQVAHLFFERDGLILGDHAGHLVFDDATGEFVVAASGWGDFDYDGLQVHHTRTSADVLSGVHVLRTKPMALPTEVSAWDPAITRIGDTWYVAFVESPSQRPFVFHPALAAGGSLDELSLVAADTSVEQTEGTILQKIGGTWYLLTSDGNAREYRVYDLEMRMLGTLHAPYGTNIPHPMIIPVPEGERTRYIMVTFNGTPYAEPVLGYGTHGDFLFMTAPETWHGHEFEPRGS